MIERINYAEPIGKSDHACLDWIYKCYANQPRTKVIKYCYNKGDFDGMRESLRREDWDKLLGKTVDEQWDIIANI